MLLWHVLLGDSQDCLVNMKDGSKIDEAVLTNKRVTSRSSVLGLRLIGSGAVREFNNQVSIVMLPGDLMTTTRALSLV